VTLAVALLSAPLIAQPAGLLFHYRFDETNGLTATDNSANARDGVLHNFGFQYPAQDVQWVTGVNLGALDFKPQAYVEVPGLPLITSTTWAAWVRKDTQANLLAYMSGDFPGARVGHALRFAETEPGGKTHPQIFWNDNITDLVNIVAPEPTEIGEWNHIAVTADAGAGQIALYVNGELAGSAAGNTTPFQIMDIGRLPERRNNYFRGSIDDVRVYNRALSAGEVLEISGLTKSGFPTILSHPSSKTAVAGQTVAFSVMADGEATLEYQWFKDGQPLLDAASRTLVLTGISTNDAGLYFVTVSNSLGSTNSNAGELTIRSIIPPEEPIGLVAEYLFNETTGLVANDTSGNHLDGTLVSFPVGDSHWQWDGLRDSRVLVFDSGALVWIDGVPSMSSATWACWVRRDFSGNHQPMISARISPDAEHTLRFVSNANIGAPGPYHPCLSYSNQVRIVAPTSVVLGQWNHIACTMDGANGVIQLYVNGELVGTDSATPTTFPLDGEMRIGRRYSATATQFLRGALDEVRIYDRALSFQEIRELFEGLPKLSIVSIRQSGPNQVELLIDTSKPGRPHRVDYKTDLAQAQWQEQPDVTFETNGLLRASFAAPLTGSSFYRVVMLEPTPIFFDDFESGAAGWTHGGTGDNWELGTPTTGPGDAFSGTNVFATGLHIETLPNADAFLRSPVIDLTGIEAATLRFMEYLKIDANPDYHRTIVQVLDSASLEVLEILAIKAGSVPSWGQRSLALGAASLGRSVILEFRIVTDEFFLQDGWYIDDATVDPE
jgi:hypothetical protein